MNTEIECQLKILSQNPKYQENWSYLFYTVLKTEQSCETVVSAIQDIIDLHHDSLDAYLVQSSLLLIYSHLKAGFEKYEGRLMHSKYASVLNLYRQRASGITFKTWQGENLKGKTIFILFEGGLGDSIHFLRYVPILKQYGCKVFLRIQEPLNCLFKHLDARIITKNQLRLPKSDFYVFMMSLPYCFKTDLSNIPPPVKIPCTLSPVKGLIGVVWKGNPKYLNDKYRSLSLTHLEPLFKNPDFAYVSLQQKVTTDEAKLLESYHVERPSLVSFTDTVRVLERCEVVICVDTSVAHLAASMGIPTWILISYVADWRWLLNRNDSPWYPSVQLFRQNKLNNWDEPIQEVQNQLLCRLV